MTNGEKMVWAAVFAREMEVLHNPPPYVVMDQDRTKWEEWEQEQACSAAEIACAAVDHLRDIINTGRLHHGFGDIGGVVQMALEMIQPYD